MQSEATLCNFCNYRTGAKQSRNVHSIMGGSGGPVPRPTALHGTPLAPSRFWAQSWPWTIEVLRLWPWPFRLCLSPHPTQTPVPLMQWDRGGLSKWPPHAPLPPDYHLAQGGAADSQSTSKAFRPHFQNRSSVPLLTTSTLAATIQVTTMSCLDPQPLNELLCFHLAPLLSSQGETHKRKSDCPHCLNPPVSPIPFGIKPEPPAVVSETLCDPAPARL